MSLQLDTAVLSSCGHDFLCDICEFPVTVQRHSGSVYPAAHPLAPSPSLPSTWDLQAFVVVGARLFFFFLLFKKKYIQGLIFV